MKEELPSLPFEKGVTGAEVPYSSSKRYMPCLLLSVFAYLPVLWDFHKYLLV